MKARLRGNQSKTNSERILATPNQVPFNKTPGPWYSHPANRPRYPRCRPFVANLTLIKVLATPKSVPPDRSRLVYTRRKVARRPTDRSCKSIFITFRRIHYEASVETRGNGLIDAMGLR